MAKMKRAPKTKVPSAAEDASDSQGTGATALEGPRSTAMKDNTKKNPSSMPPPSKCGGKDKKKRKADVMTTSTSEGPNKSSREKEPSQRKKTTEVLESGSSSSGTSIPLEKAMSDGEADSDFEEEKTHVHSLRKPQRKRGEKTERTCMDEEGGYFPKLQ